MSVKSKITGVRNNRFFENMIDFSIPWMCVPTVQQPAVPAACDAGRASPAAGMIG
jgi:hypothetical protein